MECPSTSESTYLINAVAQRVALSQKRIREYEKAGLISPEREARTNNRRYREGDIHQIIRIKELIHEHGFTLACLKFFLASAPCWIIFGCGEKEICPTYKTPGAPCYEVVREARQHTSSKACKRCPVYLNRNTDKMALLERPQSENASDQDEGG